MSKVLAIDCGTSSVKAALVSADGSFAPIARRSQVFTAAGGGYAEHDPIALIDNLLDCAREAIGSSGQEVQAISISGYHYGLLLADRNGKPITGMSTLLDRRGHRHFAAFQQQYPPAHVYQRTGGPAFAQAVLPRLFALHAEQPDLLSNAGFIFSGKSWLLYALSGAFVSEASTESASQCFDVQKQEWALDLLAPIGVKSSQLPACIHPYRDTLPLQPAIRERLGVPDACRLVAGLYDGGALCVGLNGMRTESAICNIGTSGMLRRLSKDLVLDKAEKPLLQPICLMDGHYLVGSALNSAALNLQWFKETVGVEAFLKAVPETANIPPGSQGLFFLPYLTGERDPAIGEHGTAGFIGLRPQHHLPEMIRAMIEGVSFRFGMLADAMQKGGIGFQSVCVGGGGILHFPIWPGILAAILNAEVHISPADEPALTGNAMLGFLATQNFPHMDEAMAAMIPPDAQPITATPQITATYQNLQPRFNKLSAQLSAIYPDLQEPRTANANGAR